jgi:nucleotide-binding universal stress UspA family protein
MTHLVVGIDGSQASLEALDWAADEAVRRGRPLRVVHATFFEATGPCDGRANEGPFEQVHQAAHRMLAQARDRACERHRSLEVSADLIKDLAAPALLEAGREADLLVLGSRGRGGFEGLLLGSVSLWVLAEADFPVVLVRGPAPTEQHGRIVLGVSPRHLPEAAGEFAMTEAAVRSAELDVVHAWTPDVDLDGFSVVMDPGTAQYRAEAQLRMVVDLLEEHAPRGVHLCGRTPAATATRALLDAAAQADLLVVGAHEHRVGHLGPITHALLHHAPCPVAVVPTTQRRSQAA